MSMSTAGRYISSITSLHRHLSPSLSAYIARELSNMPKYLPTCTVKQGGRYTGRPSSATDMCRFDAGFRRRSSICGQSRHAMSELKIYISFRLRLALRYPSGSVCRASWGSDRGCMIRRDLALFALCFTPPTYLLPSAVVGLPRGRQRPTAFFSSHLRRPCILLPAPKQRLT
ncbi:hypothetical protein GGS23DRAFT_534016 [Durotheca rogersii]|uniref:uncharacterized protein n=1 Tax=Durotheca rogersii TaxID=419775 RepID=UPI002220693D|nr:uncharacterized protein GGS23DRAFT_534016 [Durotheca rogersii]KAI5863442.1 hypothetical protein GGS23DRAFT_534016 [Durotheca rogersii]